MHDVFDAIANPTRRRIVSLLAETDEMPLHEITTELPISRTAVSKHLKMLGEVGLVRNRKVRRETRYQLDAAPLKEVKDWVARYEQFWQDNIKSLKQLLEEDDDGT